MFAVGQAGNPFYRGHRRHQLGPALSRSVDSCIRWSHRRRHSSAHKVRTSPCSALGSTVAFTAPHRDVPSWNSAGGGFISSPTSVIFGGETFVFGVGFDEAIWFRRLNSDWATLGGRIVSDLGVTTDGTSLYVTGLGADNAFWYQRLTAGQWSGWFTLGGDLASYPATTNEGNKGSLFAIGGDGAVWYKGVQNGVWSGWIGLGGGAESAPAVVAHGNGLIDVYIVGL